MIGEALGRQLRDERERRKLTQEQVARSLGVTQSTISALERGERDPYLSTVTRYAWLLGFRVGLLPRAGE